MTIDTKPWKVRDWYDKPGDGDSIMSNDICAADDRVIATVYPELRRPDAIAATAQAAELAALIVQLVNWWKKGVAYRATQAADAAAAGNVMPDLDHGIAENERDILHMMNGIMLERDAALGALADLAKQIDDLSQQIKRGMGA